MFTISRCSCGLAMGDRQGQAFNEEAFRYLLGIQRRRAERADRPFLLVLVDLKHEAGVTAHIEPSIARVLFAGLWQTFRETDLIGWYREEQVAGAVLIERGEGSLREVSRLITARLNESLARGLDARVARRLRVRVCQIQPQLS